ncbi:MAG: hypothetical protein ACLQVL_36150 [Terriglobia bacterium]
MASRECRSSWYWHIEFPREEAGKAHPFTVHLGDCWEARAEEAGFSSRLSAGGIDRTGAAGRGARQVAVARAPPGVASYWH